MRRRTARLAFAVLAFLPPASHAQEPRGNDTLVVRVVMNAHYDDSDESLALIRALGNALPPMRDSLAAPRRIDQLLVKWYNVAIGDTAQARNEQLPRTYAYLMQRVRELNGLSADAQVIDAPTVLLPAVPKRAFTEPNDSLGRNYLPQLMRADVGDTSATGRTLELRNGFQLMAGAERRASQFRALEVVVPGRFSEPFLARIKPLVDSGVARIMAAPIAAKADPPPERPAQTEPAARGVAAAAAAEKSVIPLGAARSVRRLSRREALATLPALPIDTIQRMMAHPAAIRRVPLIVLDVGYPGPEDYRYSRRILRDIMDSVRARWELGPRPQRAPDPPFANPQHEHAARIAEALAPFRAIDRDTLVQVVFLPFARVQGADPLLREMFELVALFRQKWDGLQLASALKESPPAFAACGGMRERRPTTFADCAAELPLVAADFAAASDAATRQLGQLPDTIRRDAAGNVDVRTSSGVLNDLLQLLHAYAMPRDTTAFVNISWVVTAYRGSAVDRLPGYSPVLMVVATGNDGIVVNRPGAVMEFGGSAVEPHVLAVMNMNARGDTICGSSIVDPRPAMLGAVNAVGFTGELPSGPCGSSFATPRVAWVLALNEALRRNPRGETWLTETIGRLRCLRTSPSLDGVLFKPTVYLDPADPNCR